MLRVHLNFFSPAMPVTIFQIFFCRLNPQIHCIVHKPQWQVISQKSWILKPNLKICYERHWWSIVRIHQSSDMCAQGVWQALRGAAYTPKGRPSTVEAHCPNKEYPYLHFFFLIYSLFRILPIRNFLHFKIQYKVTLLKTRLFIIANTRKDKG